MTSRVWIAVPIQTERTGSAVAIQNRVLLVMLDGLSVFLVRASEVILDEERVALSFELLGQLERRGQRGRQFGESVWGLWWRGVGNI